MLRGDMGDADPPAGAMADASRGQDLAAPNGTPVEDPAGSLEALTERLAARFERTDRVEVVAAIVFNLIIAVAIILIMPGGSVDAGKTAFMLFLVTLLVTLYDRYRPEYSARFGSAGAAA
jgi:hypothetical protein